MVPFEGATSAPELEWLAESFVETLSADLAPYGHRVVTREERLALLARHGLPATLPLTRASWIRLGEVAEADWVVWGSYTVADGQLRASAQALDLRSLRLSPWAEESGPLASLLEVQGQLAWNVERRLDPNLVLPRETFLERLPPVPPSAFESYVRGLLALNREQQRRYFLQSTHLAPAYSAPAFRLGQLYFEDASYPTAAAWFSRVAADDPSAPEAGFYLSLCHFYSGAYARARETLAAVAERLRVPALWNNLGVFASRQGENESAVRYFERALETQPDHADALFNLGLHYSRWRRWQEAVRAFSRTLELNPDDSRAHLFLAHALTRLGRKAEAGQEKERAGPLKGSSADPLESGVDRLEQHFSSDWHRPTVAPAGHLPAARAQEGSVE
ncbi:MAG: tetratricopeptide repeat protein [Candidatus Acidiferrales bacterium]